MEQCFGAKAGKRRVLARTLSVFPRLPPSARLPLGQSCSVASMQLARGGPAVETRRTPATAGKLRTQSRRWRQSIRKPGSQERQRRRPRMDADWKRSNFQRADRGGAAVCVAYSIHMYIVESRGFCGPLGRFFCPAQGYAGMVVARRVRVSRTESGAKIFRSSDHSHRALFSCYSG